MSLDEEVSVIGMKFQGIRFPPRNPKDITPSDITQIRLTDKGQLRYVAMSKDYSHAEIMSRLDEGLDYAIRIIPYAEMLKQAEIIAGYGHDRELKRKPQGQNQRNQKPKNNLDVEVQNYHHPTAPKHKKYHTLHDCLKALEFDIPSIQRLKRRTEPEQITTETEIRYRLLALKYHPDIAKDDGARFKQLHEAIAQVRHLMPSYRARNYDDAFNHVVR